MTHDYLPAFATNRPDLGMTVGSEVTRLFRALREHAAEAPPLAIATAYINPAGFSVIADELEQAPRVRLLLGAEPDQDAVRALAAQDADYDQRIDAALHTHEAWLRVERDTMGFDRETTKEAKRMVEWLRAVDPTGKAKIEVRRYTDGFLHGKAFISDQPPMRAVLAGSSNLTYAGMNLNAELNLGYPAGDQHHAAKVVDWFEYYWRQSDPYDLAALYEHQWDEHQPWSIFLRMLWELYNGHLDEESTPVTAFGLTQFQSDGVARMERLLDSLGGVLVADEVGLGKTYLAGEIVHRATEEQRQRVLIIAPAALKKGMWEPFLDKHGFRLTDVYSYEEIRNKMDPSHKDYPHFSARIEEYALVVIDEAHNLRNAAAARSEAVDRVILGGKYPKKVVLLTATPVNNSLTDLETLIKYFVRDDAHFAGIGIPSIRQYIRQAQALDPENLTPEHLFDLMDQVAVRRTRKFVKEQYPNEQITGPNGQPMLIRFPQPKVRRIDYELDASAIELIDRMVYALDRPDDEDIYASYDRRTRDPHRLMLARYTSSAYSINRELEGYQISNAGLLRSALLKRLESSPQALHSTLTTLIKTHEVFLAALNKGFVLQGEALREWGSSESDDLDTFVAELDEDDASDAMPASLFHSDALTEDVQGDLVLLDELRGLTAATIADGELKSARLVTELTRIAEASQRVDPRGVPASDRRKVIVFSTYSDTITALHEEVSAAVQAAPEGSPLELYKNRVAPPIMGAYASVQRAGKHGGVDMGGRAATIEGFAPETASRLTDDGRPTAEDKFDILLTTDVLAEGVNLQQAGQMINYDLPWNPMRIVQRHGRVDRIGSKHDTVQMGLFFPAERLDELLKLEATLERKLAQAEAAVGTGQVLPGRKAGTEVILADRDDAIEHIEELLDNRGSSAALSGEEYRRRLYNAFQHDPVLRREIIDLPYGSGSGFENPHVAGNGYVFCVKIANHPQPWFRYVAVNDDWTIDSEDAQNVSTDTLQSLVAADPDDADRPRWMNDEVYDRAFDAWQLAKQNVFEMWQDLTDPNNLQADAPKSFRDASDLVREHGGFLGSEEQRFLLRQLRSVPSAKVAKAVRAAIRDGNTNIDRISLIAAEVAAAGIQPPPKVEPLPDISEGEVRLVAWMAVKGKAE
ncbi:helicase-related protein [Leucobacter chinensis]|uniref:helicase-related protein n=1 Tax=Leucobacter chinensis TaxID=2851010 RepID=UPI001C23A10B|nr:helicase-related protein [Leucobacter chinensis]